MGVKRHIYYSGIEPIPADESTDNEPGDSLNTMVTEKEQSTELIMQIDTLREENEKLKRRIAELEKLCVSNLELEMDCLLNLTNYVHPGSDSIPHFESFSVDSVITEICQHAPEVFHLLSQLASTQDVSGDDDSSRSLKPAIAICTLLKSRSVQVQILLHIHSLFNIAKKIVTHSYKSKIGTEHINNS